MANLSIHKCQHKTHNICCCAFFGAMVWLCLVLDFCLSLRRSVCFFAFMRCTATCSRNRQKQYSNLFEYRCRLPYFLCIQLLLCQKSSHTHTHSRSLLEFCTRKHLDVFFIRFSQKCVFLILGFIFIFRIAIVPQHCFRQHLHDQ